GYDGLRQAIEQYHTAFPDLVNTIRDQIAEGDLVATRWTSTGTHQGPSFGLAPTGNRRDVTGIQFNRVRGGLIVEEWHSWDTLGLLRQLGATRIPGTE
ncbi:MAG: ester cyclase, partial [Actinomycetota bacterium]|nr:ester cyclase [Actinomycetota bacterium]